MSLAKGTKGHVRHNLIRGHRLVKFIEYFNRFVDGDPKVTSLMVTERGKKLKEVGGHKIGR